MNKLCISVLGLAMVAGLASADVVTFENDASGNVANGFQSVHSTNVTFTDTLGQDLYIGAFTESNNSNALVVFYDDTGGLQMDFVGMQTSLSLDFGNDDALYSYAGCLAVLTLYQGASQVGQVSVVLNNNDLMDQSISASLLGGFDRATFFYTDPQGSALSLIEVVDNVTFAPTPGAAALLGLGGLASVRRRR